jgi:hypothetical protein
VRAQNTIAEARLACGEVMRESNRAKVYRKTIVLFAERLAGRETQPRGSNQGTQRVIGKNLLAL